MTQLQIYVSCTCILELKRILEKNVIFQLQVKFWNLVKKIFQLISWRNWLRLKKSNLQRIGLAQVQAYFPRSIKINQSFSLMTIFEVENSQFVKNGILIFTANTLIWVVLLWFLRIIPNLTSIGRFYIRSIITFMIFRNLWSRGP